MFGALRMEMNSGTILGYFLQAVPVTLVVGAVYGVGRLLFLRRKGEPVRWGTELVRLLFVCYLTGLCSLVLLPANFWLRVYDGIAFGWWSEVGPIFSLGEVNLVPSLVRCLTGELSLGSWGREMLLGNVAMFLPFGVFLPFLTKEQSRAGLLRAAVAVPLAVECAQLVLGRSFDIDDLLCNFLGITLGYLVAWGLRTAGRGHAAAR